MSNLREKQIVRDEIFRKRFDGIRTGIGFSELPANLLPTDFIDIEKVDAFYSENNSWDDHTYLVVYRNRLETDEEHNDRLSKLDELKKRSREARYQQYLKLKEEFGN